MHSMTKFGMKIALSTLQHEDAASIFSKTVPKLLFFLPPKKKEVRKKKKEREKEHFSYREGAATPWKGVRGVHITDQRVFCLQLTVCSEHAKIS